MTKLRVGRLHDLVDESIVPNDGQVATWNATSGKWERRDPGSGGGPHAIVGSSHTAAGLTPGHVLRATAADAFAFGALQEADVPATIARDSEVSAAVAAHEAAGDPHPTYTTSAEANAAAASAVASHEGAADPHTGYQQEAEKGAANGYASLGADGKVPSGQLPASGSDPWTIVRLASPFTTSSTTPQAVTGFKFTPQANKSYVVYGGLLVRASGAAATGPRPGLNWPSGLTRQGAILQVGTSATALVQRLWGPTTANQNAAGTGLPDTTNSYLSPFEALLVVGASPSGDFQITLCSETSATNVEMSAGSYFMYREI